MPSPAHPRHDPRPPNLRPSGEEERRGPQRLRHRARAGNRQVRGGPRPDRDPVPPGGPAGLLPPADRPGGRARRRSRARARPLPAAPGVRALLRADPRRPVRRHRPHRLHPAARTRAHRLPDGRRRRRLPACAHARRRRHRDRGGRRRGHRRRRGRRPGRRGRRGQRLHGRVAGRRARLQHRRREPPGRPGAAGRPRAQADRRAGARLGRVGDHDAARPRLHADRRGGQPRRSRH